MPDQVRDVDGFHTILIVVPEISDPHFDGDTIIWVYQPEGALISGGPARQRSMEVVLGKGFIRARPTSFIALECSFSSNCLLNDTNASANDFVRWVRLTVLKRQYFRVLNDAVLDFNGSSNRFVILPACGPLHDDRQVGNQTLRNLPT